MIKNFQKYALMLVVSCLLLSCNPDEQLGLNMQPPGDEIGATKTDTISIIAYTKLYDSLRTDNMSLSLAGHYTDPIFGQVKASFCSQLRLTSSSNIDFGTSPTIDSVILHLQYHSVYGNVVQNNPITFEVRELMNKIYIDSSYYAFSPINIGQIWATHTFTPNDKDSVHTDNKVLAPQLRIPLDKQIGQRIIDANADGKLASNETLESFIHGFCIIPTYGANGSIVLLNLLSGNSGVTIYYHNTDGAKNFKLQTSNLCARYNNFDHFAYIGADPSLLKQINGDTTLGKEKLFLQPLGGTEIVFKLPYIKNFNKNFATIINYAELFLPIDATINNDEYPRPAKLTMAKINKNGKYLTIIDATIKTFGEFDKNKSGYRFILTKQLQNIITGGEDVSGFSIMVSGASIYPNRVVLNGQSNTTPMRLEITYTPIL